MLPLGSVDVVMARGVVTPSVSVLVTVLGGVDESVAWNVRL